MYDRLKDVFSRGYTPSILTIAAEIRLYAEIRNDPAQDRQIAAFLRSRGYHPPRPDNRTGFVPGRSLEEKEAYQMICEMITAFESTPPEESPVQPEARILAI